MECSYCQICLPCLCDIHFRKYTSHIKLVYGLLERKNISLDCRSSAPFRNVPICGCPYVAERRKRPWHTGKSSMGGFWVTRLRLLKATTLQSALPFPSTSKDDLGTLVPTPPPPPPPIPIPLSVLSVRMALSLRERHTERVQLLHNDTSTPLLKAQTACPEERYLPFFQRWRSVTR